MAPAAAARQNAPNSGPRLEKLGRGRSDMRESHPSRHPMSRTREGKAYVSLDFVRRIPYTIYVGWSFGSPTSWDADSPQLTARIGLRAPPYGASR